jgi:chromosome segregation ATPase
MTRISVKIQNSILNEIEEDRRKRGIKLSGWITNAVENYLHPAHSGTEQAERTEAFRKTSDRLLAIQAEKELGEKKLQELERRYALLKAEREQQIVELADLKKGYEQQKAKQELSDADLTRREKIFAVLQREKEISEAERSELKSRCEALTAEKETLRSELTGLRSLCDSLAAEKETLSSGVTGLKSISDRLQGERDQAITDRNIFLAEREDLKKEILEITVEAERSKAKTVIIDELRKDKDFLQVEYRKLSDHIVPQLPPPPAPSSFWSWIWGDR